MNKVATKTEYEQLEYQRKNPHLFTTMTQSVNPDGTITTYEQITKNLKESVDRAQEIHSKAYGGEHPVYCMRPLIGMPENPLCQMIEILKQDMDKCLTGFVRNYKHMLIATTPKDKKGERE